MRRQTLLPALAVLALAGMTGTATAQAGLRWQHRDSGNGPLLAWEKPDTDDQPLAFSCDANSRRLHISYVHQPAQDSREIPLELSSEGGRVQVPMRGAKSELGDQFMLNAETRLTPELAAVLSRGKTLTLRVRGRAMQIPLAGSAEGVAALVRQCGAAPTG